MPEHSIRHHPNKKEKIMIKTNLNIDLNELELPPQYRIDTERMKQTEMKEKASFLIKGNLASGTQALVKGIPSSMGIQFQLKNCISLNQFGEHPSLYFPNPASVAVLTKNEKAENVDVFDIPEYYGRGCIRLKISKDNIQPSGRLCGSRYETIQRALDRCCEKFDNIFDFLKENCEAITSLTPEKTCKFFGYSPLPRGENVSAPLYRQHTFPEMPRLPIMHSENNLLEVISELDKPANIPDSSLVYSFPTEWGDAMCKVGTVYDHATRTKTLCPMTVFYQNGCNNPEMFRFLNTKIIPWSERDFQDKEIVITTNVEFAFWNRERFLAAGKILITFPETYGCHEFLDLKALNKAAKVYLMVANFANETMAEACLAQLPFAEAICDALDDKSKFGVFMMSLSFEPIPDDILTTAELAEFINEHKPLVKETCIATDLDDFKTVCSNFEQKIHRRQEAEEALYTIMDEMLEEGKTVAVPDKNATAKTQWLMRSAVDKGGHIEIIAQEKTGKTNFAVCVAYEFISANQRKTDGLIPGRFFTVAKNAIRKVAYFDTELGAARFTAIRNRVKDAYLPKKSKEAAELDANFIHHDLFTEGYGEPYAKRENHQKILDMLEADKQVGTPGAVGLVILDTRRGFTRDQVGLEPQFSDLIRKIRQLGYTVLVLHHMNGKNEAAGNYSVTTGKTGMIKMFRDYVSPEESREKCNLSHPVKFQLSSYGIYQTAMDTEPFYAKCEDGRWTLMEMVGKPDGLNTQFQPVEFDSKAILQGLVKDYKKNTKMTMAAIAESLGTTDDTLTARLK